MASVALANVWFENEAKRFRKDSKSDPWNTFDNFRINHRAKRDFTLAEGDDKSHYLKIEYLSENKFNVYKQSE